VLNLVWKKKTDEEWYQHEGLIPHDFRRSAEVDESTAMRITGSSVVEQPIRNRGSAQRSKTFPNYL